MQADIQMARSVLHCRGCTRKSTYFLKKLNGTHHKSTIAGNWLKQFHIWQQLDELKDAFNSDTGNDLENLTIEIGLLVTEIFSFLSATSDFFNLFMKLDYMFFRYN